MAKSKKQRTIRIRRDNREAAVMVGYAADGWEIVTRGMPVFLAIDKKGPIRRPARFVWVLRECGLTLDQQKVFAILSTLGLDARMEDPKAYPPVVRPQKQPQQAQPQEQPQTETPGDEGEGRECGGE